MIAYLLMMLVAVIGLAHSEKNPKMWSTKHKRRINDRVKMAEYQDDFEIE